MHDESVSSATEKLRNGVKDYETRRGLALSDEITQNFDGFVDLVAGMSAKSLTMVRLRLFVLGCLHWLARRFRATSADLASLTTRVGKLEQTPIPNAAPAADPELGKRIDATAEQVGAVGKRVDATAAQVGVVQGEVKAIRELLENKELGLDAKASKTEVASVHKDVDQLKAVAIGTSEKPASFIATITKAAEDLLAAAKRDLDTLKASERKNRENIGAIAILAIGAVVAVVVLLVL